MPIVNLSYLDPAASAALRKELVLEAAALENIEVGWSHKKLGTNEIFRTTNQIHKPNFSSNTSTFRRKCATWGLTTKL